MANAAHAHATGRSTGRGPRRRSRRGDPALVGAAAPHVHRAGAGAAPPPAFDADAARDEQEPIHARVTREILDQLEAGALPWTQPWDGAKGGAAVGMPFNARTGAGYSGINVLLLWGATKAHAYTTHCWLTAKQAAALGGRVRPGERPCPIVKALVFKRAAGGGGAGLLPLAPAGPGAPGRTAVALRHYAVYNVNQCEGLPPELGAPPAPLDEGLIEPAVLGLIRASGADFRVGSREAYYSPSSDVVVVPRPEAYFRSIDWHRTALHEMAHWTGAQTRLRRDLSGSRGSALYAREELVAELASAFVCASLGIVPSVRHADYLASWIGVLREDSRAVLRAASAASRAAQYLLGFHQEERGPEEGKEERQAERRPDGGPRKRGAPTA